MIIGITGTHGAGKGTTVEHLMQRGYAHQSVRAFIIEDIHRRGMPNNRDSMVIVANDLRKTHSPSYLVEQLYERAQREGGHCVIESIRTLGEAEALQAKDRFLLLSIDAEPKTRYERVQERGSETDHVTYERFLADEEREMTSEDPAEQNIRAVMARADFSIRNDGTFEDLHREIERVLGEIRNA